MQTTSLPESFIREEGNVRTAHRDTNSTVLPALKSNFEDIEADYYNVRIYLNSATISHWLSSINEIGS